MKSNHNLLLQGMSGRLGGLSVAQQNGQTIVRERPMPTKRVTQAQQVCRSAFKTATGIWPALSAQEMASWRQIAPKIPRWDAKPGAAPLTGQRAFVQTAVNRAVLELDVLRLAPFAPTLPAFLPDIKAHLLFDGTTWRLTITGGPFDGPLQVMATPMQSRGRDALGLRQYAQIAVLPGLGADAEDLTDAYVRKFAALRGGTQVGVRLCPLSPEGFRGLSLTLSAMGE